MQHNVDCEVQILGLQFHTVIKISKTGTQYFIAKKLSSIWLWHASGILDEVLGQKGQCQGSREELRKSERSMDIIMH